PRCAPGALPRHRRHGHPIARHGTSFTHHLNMISAATDDTMPGGPPEAASRGEKESLLAQIKSILSGEALVRADEPLAKRTTLRVGGDADFYVEPATEDDLSALLRWCSGRQVPFVVLGRGSNLLVRDGGIRGVVI